jgi:phage shock protein PspC (stress-responsive transcriptional regulator)
MIDVFIRKDGLVGGVCGGLARKLDIPAFVLRIALVVSFFCTFGITLLIYFAAVVSFPNQLTAAFTNQPKFLGVCHRLAPKFNIHETWMRFALLVVFIFTGFVPVFAGYMLVFLIMAATTEESRPRNPSGFRDVN